MGPRVKEVEKELAQRSGYNYCVATSSGSTANTLLAMWVAQSTKKRKILVSSVGWSTTVTPFLRENFEPIFVDVWGNSPTMSAAKLDEALKENSDVAGVFYTTLLGIRNGRGSGDLNVIKNVCEKHGVELYVDSCEDTMGMFRDYSIERMVESSHGMNYISAETTSFYLAHEFQACPEMGAIFTNDKDQYEFYLMARNHGMTRHLEDKGKFKNDLVDPKFEFGVVGNNFRPTELSAYAVSLDLKRKQNFRIDIAKEFYYSGSSKIYHYALDYMFALPIVIRQEYGEEQAKYFIDKIKGFAEELGIETRPIVGGNLLRQTIFQEYGNYRDYPNAEWFHKYGIYVGLYKKMNKKLLLKFRDKIDTL
jgi:CDP-6-deoxy-D-xylo-4-hexulose-3-dehydrase